MDEVHAYPRIPYGESDFRGIRLNRWLYVDKTRFLRRLEQERYALLIRPRRFGKSLWVSVLENYYDRWWGHEFDAVFAGTDIGRHPTEERHRYVVLRFDFSSSATSSRSWRNASKVTATRSSGGRCGDIPACSRRRLYGEILASPSITEKLGELFGYVGDPASRCTC